MHKEQLSHSEDHSTGSKEDEQDHINIFLATSAIYFAADYVESEFNRG